MSGKGLKTTVQELNGKYTTPIPMALVNLLGLKKKDKFMWKLEDNGIIIEVVKA